jgi:hypothetical protein
MRANSDPNRSVQANSKISRGHCKGFGLHSTAAPGYFTVHQRAELYKERTTRTLRSSTETNPPLFDPHISYRKTSTMFEHPALNIQSRSIKRADTVRSVKPLSGPESNNTMTVSLDNPCYVALVTSNYFSLTDAWCSLSKMPTRREPLLTGHRQVWQSHLEAKIFSIHV